MLLAAKVLAAFLSQAAAGFLILLIFSPRKSSSNKIII